MLVPMFRLGIIWLVCWAAWGANILLFKYIYISIKKDWKKLTIKDQS